MIAWFAFGLAYIIIGTIVSLPILRSTAGDFLDADDDIVEIAMGGVMMILTWIFACSMWPLVALGYAFGHTTRWLLRRSKRKEASTNERPSLLRRIGDSGTRG